MSAALTRDLADKVLFHVRQFAFSEAALAQFLACLEPESRAPKAARRPTRATPSAQARSGAAASPDA